MERVGAAQWGSAEVGASLGATPALRLMKRLTVTPIGTGSCCPTTSGARRCCDMDWSPPQLHLHATTMVVARFDPLPDTVCP